LRGPVISQRYRHLGGFLAALARRHPGLVTHMVFLGIYAELARAGDLAAIRAEIVAQTLVRSEHRTGIQITTGVGRIGFDEWKFEQIDFVASQNDFLTRLSTGGISG
jgi:hypothetical protein